MAAKKRRTRKNAAAKKVTKKRATGKKAAKRRGRKRSETTIEKVEFAKSIVAKDPSVTQAGLRDQVIEKFGSGLDFRILGNVQKGKDPFGKPRGRKKATRAMARKAGKKRAGRRGRKKAGRRGRRPSNPFASAPAYVVAVAGDGTSVSCAGKAEARAAVSRLVDRGVSPEDVVVYSRERIAVETRHVVNF